MTNQLPYFFTVSCVFYIILPYYPCLQPVKPASKKKIKLIMLGSKKFPCPLQNHILSHSLFSFSKCVAKGTSSPLLKSLARWRCYSWSGEKEQPKPLFLLWFVGLLMKLDCLCWWWRIVVDNRVSKTRVASATKLIGEDEVYVLCYYTILLHSIPFDDY